MRRGRIARELGSAVREPFSRCGVFRLSPVRLASFNFAQDSPEPVEGRNGSQTRNPQYYRVGSPPVRGAGEDARTRSAGSGLPSGPLRTARSPMRPFRIRRSRIVVSHLVTFATTEVGFTSPGTPFARLR